MAAPRHPGYTAPHAGTLFPTKPTQVGAAVPVVQPSVRRGLQKVGAPPAGPMMPVQKLSKAAIPVKPAQKGLAALKGHRLHDAPGLVAKIPR